MKKQNQHTETEQEKLSQQALGNTAVELNSSTSDNELKSPPKTTGTGGHPASSTPNSLIVHEDEKGDDRYEDGEESKTE